jgi:hypothetical protein
MTPPERRLPHGAPAAALVHVRYQGHPIGLYGIHEADEQTMKLRHGPIAFPVGTQLLVEDLVGLRPGGRPRMFCATVTRSDSRGMSLTL